MNIVLIHIGNKLPEYFYDCVKQIRKHYSGNLFVCFEENLNNKNLIDYFDLKFLPVNEFLETNRIKEFELKSNLKQQYGEFWDCTFRRIFILEEIIKKYELTDVLHIENDVLIYSNPEELKFDKIFKDKIAVNPVSNKYATYAYCYIPNYNSIKIVNDRNLEILSEGLEILNSRYNEGMVNEMLILGQMVQEKIVDLLPTLPFNGGSDNFEYFDTLFDGSAYGQYVSGTPFNPPGWMERNRYIGEALLNDEIKVHFQYREPFIVYNNKIIKLNNLHIHSKELKKWIMI